jgi:hypothetical protein
LSTNSTTTRLPTRQKIIWLGIFGLTMGYFEAAVVEYLRVNFYPDGFAFPLKDLPPRLLLIELGREAASVLMLFSVGWIAGRTFMDRFAGFMFGFAVWDIAYYFWLKIFENWPASLYTNDLLFLIPLPWVGPVWAPIGVSLALIWAAIIYWRYLDRGDILRLSGIEWLGEACAGLIIIASFLRGAPAAVKKSPLPDFPWWLFFAGMSLGVALFLRSMQRSRKHKESS